MIFPKVDPKSWAKLYDIEPRLVPCRGCGKVIPKTVPFADEKLRGLRTENHGCGDEFHQYTFVRVDKQGRLFYQNLF